jgi:hypothetical protein
VVIKHTNSLCSCTRQRTRYSIFIVSESLFPIRSHRNVLPQSPCVERSVNYVVLCNFSSQTTHVTLMTSGMCTRVMKLLRKEDRNSLVTQDRIGVCQIQTNMNKKACEHMNLRAHTRNEARSTTKAPFWASRCLSYDELLLPCHKFPQHISKL